MTHDATSRRFKSFPLCRRAHFSALLLALFHASLIFASQSHLAAVQTALSLGLPSNAASAHGIAIGVLPDWSHEGPMQISAALGKGISIIGDYINVSPQDYSLSQVQYHLPEILRIARGSVKPVYAPAIIYSDNLATWTQDMTNAVASMVKQVNDQGIVVWLRLLFEMNGGWMPYGLQPELFISVWQQVTLAVRAQTNTTYMLWSPNVFSGNVDDPVQGYTVFWPGEIYVDVAGLSYYSSGFNKSINQAPSTNAFKELFSPYYSLLNPEFTSPSSRPQNLLNLTGPVPVVISETSAQMYYILPETSPYYSQSGDTDLAGDTLPNISDYKPSLASPPFPRSDDELYIKATWFVQLTGNGSAAAFPNLIAVSWFNYLKRGGEETEVLVDFRALGGNSSVESWFRGYAGNQTAFEQGYTGSSSQKFNSKLYIWTATIGTALTLLGMVLV